MGAKPLDEALVQDAMFRFNTYRAKDRSRRERLGEAVKMNILAGEDINQEQLEKFAEGYAETGGNQAEFSQWMARQYRNVTVPQAEQLRNRLNSPYVSHLQSLLGGARFQTDLDTAEE
jgi:predicted N-acyltransferase